MKKKIFSIIFSILSFYSFAQYSKTINISTAGTLSSRLTTTEKNSITNLTVTGNIDARDIKTMRDDMQNLATLNIAAVTINEYTGSSGTDIAYTIYPANEMPKNSFCFNTSEGIGKTTLKSITLPNNLTKIGNYAFSNCSGLSGSLNIPNTVITIGENAFYMCNGFKGSLILGSRVESIEDYAFSNCSGFTGNLTIPNSVIAIGYRTFNSCIGFTGTLTLGNGLTTIGGFAFSYCSNFTGSLFIPNSVTYISGQAFENCKGFKGSLIIGTGITTILTAAFQNCTGFTSCTIIGEKLEYIGQDMFRECNNLKELTLPKSINEIGPSAFYNCKLLNSIHLKSTTPPISLPDFTGKFSSFYNVSRTLCTLYVPIGSRSNYYKPGSGTVWGEFVNVIEETTALNLLKNEQIKIYPNPAIENFKIDGLDGNATLRLTDMGGKLLIEQMIQKSDFVSVGKLPKGVYFVKLITNEGVVEKKVIKN
jgi:hypothetical protein